MNGGKGYLFFMGIGIHFFYKVLQLFVSGDWFVSLVESTGVLAQLVSIL